MAPNARSAFTDFAPFTSSSSDRCTPAASPNELDNTFGPRVLFTRNPGGRANTPSTEVGLYFGQVKIDARTQAITVSHRDLTGAVLHEVQFAPRA